MGRGADRHADRRARPAVRATPGAVRRVVLLGLLLNLGLVAFCAATYGGGAEWFVKFGEDGAYTPYARDVLGDDLLVPLEDGHDGQGYWLQARDPLLVDGDRMAATFDRPAYRAQRMLYPTLAAPFRLVGEDAVLWGLVVVNLVAVGFGTLWATRLAQATGAPERAGLAFALNPLIAISLVMDFADALALAGLVGVALAVHRQRWGWAVAAGVAAVLAKDVTGVALAALVLLWPVAGAVRRRWAIVVVPRWLRRDGRCMSAGGWVGRPATSRSSRPSPCGGTSTPTGGGGANTATGVTRCSPSSCWRRPRWSSCAGGAAETSK